MEKNLLAVRLNAHLQFMSDRIPDAHKRRDFVNTMMMLMEGHTPSPKSATGGAEMAVDAYLEIYYIHLSRFEKGRINYDFFLEKL